MTRILCLSLLALASVAAMSAEDRKNLSIEDVIAGFEDQSFVYFEIILQDGKYTKAFNRCVASKPAAPSWMRQHCKKNPELKNAFQCADDTRLTHIWFVYDSAAQCEEVRKPMKDKMDALLTQ